MKSKKLISNQNHHVTLSLQTQEDDFLISGLIKKNVVFLLRAFFDLLEPEETSLSQGSTAGPICIPLLMFVMI